MQRVIEGDAVVLRPAELQDVASLRRLGRTPTAIPGFPQPGDPPEQAERWLASALARGVRVFCITREGGTIGVVTVEFEGGAIARVGYDVDDSKQEVGACAEALRLVSGWIFRESAAHRIELDVTDASVALWRVAQRAGYGLEGVARARCRWAGVWHDVRRYALLRDEWVQARRSPQVGAAVAYLGQVA